MDPLAPAVVRAAGGVARVALGPYRPAGVARAGSAEDRAQSYRRLLDAVAHAADAQIVAYYRLRRAENAHPLRRALLRARLAPPREPEWDRYDEAQFEVHAALLGVRLCAPAPVLAAAEELVRSIPRYYRLDQSKSTLPEHEYLAAQDLRRDAQFDFLEAARHDLAYNPRFWQVLRKRRERKYRERAAEE